MDSTRGRQAAALATGGPRDVPVLIGDRASSTAHELREFLTHNRVLFEWVDAADDPLVRFLTRGEGVRGIELPVCLFPDGSTLESPSLMDLAVRIGLRTRPSEDHYDLGIVGGGPAGLTAAVYAASEGLRTVVFERHAPGGQAGKASRIENYLGFPDGISGEELTERALGQARRFGAEIVLVNEIVEAKGRDPAFVLQLLDGTIVRCDSVLAATGVAYRFLDAPGVTELTGAGVYYGASPYEALFYRDRDVFIVGGANSAAQAALHFARTARTVRLLVRSDGLEEGMSRYLVERIARTANIEVRTRTRVTRARGGTCLEAIDLRDDRTGRESTEPAEALFVLIGGAPCTAWTKGFLELDEQGYIVSGPELVTRPGGRDLWPLHRPPYPLETSVPGLFVAGDARLGSAKRVSSAVGEGAMAAALINQFLRETPFRIEECEPDALERARERGAPVARPEASSPV